MNLDSLSFAQFQITNSVSNLSKRTYKSYTSEILNLVTEFGEEAERHLIRCLFSFIDFSSDTRTSGKDAYQIQFLNQEFTALICKPNFTSLICSAIENPFPQQKSLKPSSHLLNQLSKTLRLTAVQDIALGLSLQYSSSPDIRKYSTQFLKQKLLQLINSLIETDSGSSVSIEGSIRDAPTELLQQICYHLQSELFRKSVGILPEQRDQFFQALKRGYPQGLVPVVLAPYLNKITFDLSIDNSFSFELTPAAMITSLVDTLHEIGYSFSKSKEQCRSALVQFGVKNVTPAAVAKVLGFMARVPAGFVDPLTGQNPFIGNTSNWPDGGKENLNVKQDSGQSSTWNVEIFIQTVKELVPSLQGKDVVKELDYPGFYVSNKSGFENLVKGLFLIVDAFPIDFLYSPWKNKEGQISWISNALKHPDVFCFANFAYTSVDVSFLKNPPDDKLRDIATWKSLELINILFSLSDDGLQSQVLELLKFPMTQCPDLLLIGILQNRWYSLTQDVVATLLPIFLGQHNNALSVLTFTWHIQGNQNPTIRTMVLRAMADWYSRDQTDSSRLARILDMAQDLKALSTLLNAPPNPFVIDLACLASRREYLKLDKWVNDKIREHGEPFIEECTNFVITRLSTSGLSKEEAPALNAKSPSPTTVESHNFNILLTCIQNFMTSNRNVSPALQENVSKMSQLLKQKHQQQQSGTAGNRINSSTAGMTPISIAASQSDHISGMNALPYNAFALNPNQSLNPHAQFQRTLPPGSPAKGFSMLGGAQLNQQPLSNTQLYNATVPGLNVHNSLSNGYGGPSIMSSQLSGTQGLGNGGLNNHNLNPALGSSLLGGASVLGGGLGGMHSNVSAPTLGALSAQAALTHQRQIAGMSNMTINDLVAGLGNQQFNKDVEDEANSYFKRIFNTASSQPGVAPLTVDELLELMRKFKHSPNSRENEVYSCMIRNLFEEYKFFSQYPDRELVTTANLFGGLVEYDLVNAMTLGLALKCILEALKKQLGNKMYMFGLTAVDRFKTKLKDYPQFCHFLSILPNLSDFPTVLREYITYGTQSMDVPHSANTTGQNNPNNATEAINVQSSTSASTPSNHGAIRPPNSSYRNSIANATNIDTLLANKEGIGDVAVPSEALQDKIFFIFNNLSQANMDQKASEMIDQVGVEYMDWVAQYLVMRRASIEPNFHTLYLNFVDHLPKPGFQDRVISETYRNIKVLLRSDKGCSNFSDRTLLKNLGHWLGMLMLAKNKPILQLELDLKALIYEAYMKGPEDLLYVVPFVAKVLESAGKSRVFRPPNPWTMATMNVLAELHREPELKLNLKFEIEVLCKNLQVDINELEPGQYLKDPSRLQTIVLQLSPNKQNKVEPAASVQEDAVDMNVSMTVTPAVANQTHSQPAAQPVATTGVSNMDVAPLQQYGYQDVPSMTPSMFSHNIVINDQGVALFHQHPQLKQYVKPAIERAVQELLSPAIDRAVNIALKTSEIIIKKDFALEPDENKMRGAAHNFVRFMTAGMALITCHEPVLISIVNNLKTMLASALRIPSPQQKDMIEIAAQMVAQDNAELATVFLQKTAIERALPEIDKRLATDYESRRMARSEGRPYYDQAVFMNQERLPEKIRLKLGGVTQAQMSVYEEFTRNIPGFLPPFADHGVPAMHPHFKNLQQTLGAEDVIQTYEKIARDLEQNLGMLSGSPLQALLQQLLDHVLQCRTAVRDINCAIALLQRAVEGLMEGLLMASIPGAPETPEQATRFRDCHLLVLKFLQDHRVYGPQWTNKQVTRCLLECREELRYSFDAIQALLQNQLVVISQYDHILATLIDGNSGYLAIPFAMQIIQRFCIESEKHPELRLLDGEFACTIEALQRAALHSRGPETLAPLLEMLRQQTTETGLIDRSIMGTASSMMNSGIAQANEFNDPPGFQEKAEFLIREWVNTYHTVANNRDIKPFNHFISQMWFQGVLKTDELITRFFRVSTECCVNICYRVLTEPNHNPSRIRFQCFNTLDAFVRLIVLLLKHSGDHNNNVTKINLLNKVLGVVTGVLLHDHEAKRTDFHPLPYHRIFIMLFIELNAPDPIFETLNIEVLTAFANAMHNLRPAKAASFSFAWIEIISHRVFIGKMLALNRNHKTWGMYAQLIVDLFAFQAPYLRNADLPKAIQQMYKGTMRVFLLLLHDFPELLVEYHCALCDVIPTNCIQIRNLVLSAYPKNMRLPDPFTPNLRVDMLSDINQPPKVSINYVANIQPLSLKKDLDSYLKTRSPVTFLSDLRGRLQVSNNPGMKYNIPLINSLVLYVGSQAILHIQSKGLTPSVSTIAHSSHMDIFQNLAVDLDTEGRYLFLNAMVNHLRYPNSHTQYFSSSILYLFAEANTEAIQEQIMRVLLERLIVNRPHPWGLLVTFIELIKNPMYKFWSHEFVHCAPEVDRLLDSVARSCMMGKVISREAEAVDVR